MFMQTHFEYLRPRLQEPKGEVDNREIITTPTSLTHALPWNSMPSRVATKVQIDEY